MDYHNVVFAVKIIINTIENGGFREQQYVNGHLSIIWNTFPDLELS
jgi:hypothetical protein